MPSGKPNKTEVPTPPSDPQPILDRREHFQKKFKNFNGLPPHLRIGKTVYSYPTLTDGEITATRALIAYLLVREYGFSIADIYDILRCVDGAEAEKLLSIGDDIAVDSQILVRMKDTVFAAAKQIIAAAEPFESKQRMLALLTPPKRKTKVKVKPPQARRSTVETRTIRCVIAHILSKEFGFKLKNIVPILGYPTREDVRMMEIRGERLLLRTPEYEDGQRMLAAAKAIVAKATEPV